MSRLLLLFVVVPAVELVLLVEIGERIGTLPTLGLIVVTGALGIYLARRQGLGVLRRMREEAAAGRLPAAPVMDRFIILIAGALNYGWHPDRPSRFDVIRHLGASEIPPLLSFLLSI